MFKLVKKIMFFITSLLVLTYILLVIVGRGFGEKNAVTINFPTKNLTLFAHRGVTKHAPENSLKAILNAKERGFKAIEIDIQKTSDEKLVLFHDESGKRLLNQLILINDISYAKLEQFPLIEADSFSQEKVITLKKAFDEFNDSFVYYLDIKCENQIYFYRLVEQLNTCIERHNLENKVIIASANILFIGYIEYFYPKLHTVLEGFNSGKEWIYDFTPKLFRPDFVSSFHNKVDNAHIEWLKERRLLHRKIIYGVSDKNYKKLYDNFGITKMIIDYHSSLDSALNNN